MQYSNSAQTHKNYLRPKQVIGSCKLPTNFKASQTVFHQDDIPLEKRERRNDVKQWSKSKILSVDQPEWTNSTGMSKPVCERRTMENHIHDRSKAYQYNYRAEVLPNKLPPPIDKSTKFHVSRQNSKLIEELKATIRDDETGIARGKFKITQEMPVHPKLEGALGWDSSNKPVSKNIEAKNHQLTQRAFTWNKKKNLEWFGDTRANLTNKNKTATNTDLNIGNEIENELDEEDAEKPCTPPPPKCQYISPMESYNKILEEVRKNKSNGTFTTKTTIFQKVAEPVDRRTLKNRLAIEPSRKYKVTEHSGRWEYNAAEGRHMWSDTGSFIYESRGDVVYTKNPDAYNYTNTNGSQPSWKLKVLSASMGRTLPPTTTTTNGFTLNEQAMLDYKAEKQRAKEEAEESRFAEELNASGSRSGERSRDQQEFDSDDEM